MEDIVKIEKRNDAKKIIIYSTVAVVVIAVVVGVLFYFDLIPKSVLKTAGIKKPQVIEETLTVPNTQNITGAEGRKVEGGSVNVPLVPKDDSEKVIVSKAVLTTKSSYGLAKPEAQKWSADAKLVFIKSLGAVDLEGKSSEWQLAFSSKTKPKKGYEIIIQADQIASKKELDSSATGADVPSNIQDSGDAVKELQELPQFSNATISSIQLYFNQDAKAWFYSFATSLGTTSGPAQ